MSERQKKNHAAATEPAGLAALKKAGVSATENGEGWQQKIDEMIQWVGADGVSREARLLASWESDAPVPRLDPASEDSAGKILTWIQEQQREMRQKAILALESAAQDLVARRPLKAERIHQDLSAALASGGPLKRAAKRVEEKATRWEALMEAQSQVEQLERALKIDDYPRMHPMARSMGRKIIALLGPTNSGKTHAAHDMLCESHSGAYLAPLRLLALEGKEAIEARGKACSLITGEERKINPQARFVSSTVEMARLDEAMDRAIIDEIQMIMDPARGWAWTQAFCAMPVKELIVVGAPEALPMIEKLAQRLGEPLEVRRFERKTPLIVEPKALGERASAQKGDAWIAFSRREAHAWRERLTAQGLKVAVIYGALAPEVRQAEAKRFASGEADAIVATDAIGMGLNLPIRRVVFTTLKKFDGEAERWLDEHEIRQIAGRAGRHGLQDQGAVVCLDGSGHQKLQQAMAAQLQGLDGKVSVTPTDEQIQRMSQELGQGKLTPLLCYFRDNLLKDDPLFEASAMEDMIELAWRADRREKLSIQQRFMYAKAPMDQRDEELLGAWEEWMRSHEKGQKAKLAPAYGGGDLARLERRMKMLTAYLWLSWRFQDVYADRNAAEQERESTCELIEQALSNQAKAKAMAPRGKNTKPAKRKHSRK